MKKLVKIFVIVILAIAVLIGLYWGGIRLLDNLHDSKLNKERINGSTTLSNYVKYHDLEHSYIYNKYNGEDEDISLNFYAKNIKCDLIEDKNILYYSDGIMILDDYTVYETAFTSEKTFSNGQQCKPIETDVKFNRLQIHYNTPYLIGDNKIYTIDSTRKKLVEANNVPSHDTSNESSVYIGDFTKRIILTNEIVKTSNNFDNFAVLKTDGQVYLQKYNSISHVLESESVLVSSKEYGKILDFVYSIDTFDIEYPGIQFDEYKIILLVTEKGLYYLKNKNNQDYIDSTPEYELVSSDIYTKYSKDVKYIGSDYIFTTDNNIIRTSMLCKDIDKDVK